MIDGPVTAAPLSIAQSLRSATQRLHALAGETQRLDAELLLAHVLGCDRVALIRNRDEQLDPEAASRYDMLVAARAEGRPVAYLLGRQEFWGLSLTVNEHVLVPRSETEALVTLCLEHIAPDGNCHILDLGTGSGAIALAIAVERPLAFVIGVDRSRRALAVARTNVARTGARNVALVQGDWTHALATGGFDLVVANPPYVHEDDPALAASSLRFEPRQALAAGPDGLADLRTLAANAARLLTDCGWLLLEHGATQGPAVRALLTAAGFVAVTTRRDLARHERITLGRRNGDTNG
jgi:release factor glutamine methyltransferase